MLFSSFTFLVCFLPFTALVYYLLPHKFRNMFLLIMSLIFYMWGSPQYLLVMIAVIIMNYFVGILIDNADKIDASSRTGGGTNQKWFHNKKKILIIGIILNVSVLFIFKYLTFATNNLNELLKLFGFNGIHIIKIALPIGISFYIFQSISYLVDIYRKDAPVQRNFKNLALYISMFPQLVAGPIVRYNSIAKDIERERNVDIETFALGLQIFIIGLAKKVLVANNMAIIADDCFSQVPQYISALTAWIGAVSYTFQIYFDFSGYSDMAIGLGLMFGFKFPLNFNYPYISKSITEFWRRWHISLSSWFKDYVYIPLGGNRVKVSRMYINLFIVFIITGIWHGASWSFLVWGLFHGMFLVVEKITGIHKTEKFKALRWLATMVIVIIGWVIFRAPDLSYAVKYIGAMFGIGYSGYNLLDLSVIFSRYSYIIILICSFIGSTPIVKKTLFRGIDAFNPERQALWLTAFQCAVLFFALLVIYMFLANASYNPFIYFRF